MTPNDREKGFTLLSAILALFALCMTILLICQLRTVIRHLDRNPQKNSPVVWISAHQIETELLNSTTVQITNQTLTFVLNDQTISYSLQGLNLVRQLNNQGYEIVLQDVLSVDFKKTGSVISMRLTMKQGGQYTWLFLCENS